MVHRNVCGYVSLSKEGINLKTVSNTIAPNIFSFPPLSCFLLASSLLTQFCCYSKTGPALPLPRFSGECMCWETNTFSTSPFEGDLREGRASSPDSSKRKVWPCGCGSQLCRHCSGHQDIQLKEISGPFLGGLPASSQCESPRHLQCDPPGGQ